METLTTVLRAGLSLACVLGLVWVLAKMARKHPLNRRTGTDRTEVLARQQLSRAASLAVVRVGARTLVLGVTEQQVTLLHEGPLGDELDADDADPDELEPVDLEKHSPGTALAPVRSLPTPVPAPVPTDVPTDAAVAAGGRRAARTAEVTPRKGALAGSALSPATWLTAVEVLRERTVRR